ncbi:MULTISPECIES: DUF6510 family protein [Nocardiopsis]|uniref:Uncharacterized protein n=1 Tax=Nocardiopsis dassonvillei (strain ATCC 23218 / DSM 43111 / CIP 107115 / JCM 7437 / KCTC 9190 / NBRC 14626 / NCTC 10488 / NRRL B-5397 / IMRU 509) TaxID=446468 RepID=D7B2X6_NOCDD|nr:MULTISPECIES: DUF6510 family protein [Nocardiopsis]ADH68666.1 conserved hypothetical protein [Nocardiopsis dassonvillei subsp. dassonvillei DSM 43111]APC36731.1 hypothetical protein A9R04_19515 [Nocardiopsis dassonvillei]ASU59671.1 hypothetical protein CGQ36_19785 [Nocardiopsis dassonvillei]NKY80478.1 hypothetical protein [Nocardiopsis dassonvillei]VEI89175.1 Uncharacterised protein [Nocardiopsis dassonvillei]
MREPEHMDANVLAGPLSEIMSVDLTSAERRCSVCGACGTFAELYVTTDGPGLVASCPRCRTLVLRLVRTPDSVWLDLGGTGVVRIRLGL